MLLAIDAGNTNTVFAVIEGDAIRAQWRASTVASRTADEYGVWLSQLMGLEGIKPEAIKGAVISSVVPQAVFNLRVLCHRYLKSEPMLVGHPDLDLGLKINLQHPEAVGADRLVNAIAAHERYKGALIIIDFGTATTFDIVSKTGAYEGGIIAPGVNLSLEALNQAAAKLPRIAVERPKKVIGGDTIPAMQSGIFWGYIGLIEGLVARIRAEYSEPMNVIATGGLSHLFIQSTDAIEHLDDDLTIRGLKLIYDRNAANWPPRREGDKA